MNLSDTSPRVPVFTTEEVAMAVAKLSSGKAPGPDLVPNELVRLAFKKFPAIFVDCFNACLVKGDFPLRWKRANLVLIHKGHDKPRDVPITCGVPQGSVLGATLWNLFYDGVLRLPVRDGIRLVAFADDVAVVAAARNAQIIELLANSTLADIVDWMSNNGFQLAPKKSECKIFTKKYVYRDPELYIQGCLVPVRRSVRYLGVHLDTRLSFGEHVATVAAGARKAVGALGKLMPNVGGPSQCKRSLLMSVVNSRLLYCTPVWADGVQPVQKYKNILVETQRCAALRVARCYGTVSDMAALALARMPPAFLQASARKSAVEARNAGAARTKHEIVEDILSK